MLPRGLEFWFLSLLGRWSLCLLYLLTTVGVPTVRGEFSYEATTAVLALINVTYFHPTSSFGKSETEEMGRYADGAVIGTAVGVVVAGKPPANSTSASLLKRTCLPNWATPPADEPWVALLERGGCSDEEKVKLAISQNASAVLFYGDDQSYFKKRSKFKGNIVVIYLLKDKGRNLSDLIDKGYKITVNITKGREVKLRITSINRTSVLFVSVSFIVLMVVSLAWLIFYYIQRFRYINAKDRLAKHLSNAAKKALAKIPVRTLKSDEKAIAESESCAVCIECYAPGDSLRSLPCKHEFHKICVDPWLLEHQTCPMCKMDILKYYGYIPSATDSSGARTESLEDSTSADAAGNFHRNFEQTPSSLFDDTQRPIQVSVISHSEILPTSAGIIDSRGSSTPLTSITTPIPTSQPNISFGTTTAIIRSVILSTTPQAVSNEAGNDQMLPSVHACSAPATYFGPNSDGSILVQIRDQMNEEDEYEEENSNDEDTESSVSDSASRVPSPFEEYRDSTPPLPSEGKKTEMSTINVVVADPAKRFDRKENTVCDIECLVNEIFDLERDENEKSDKSDKSERSERSEVVLDTGASPTPQSIEDLTKGEEHIARRSSIIDRPIINTRSSLPIVDCNPQTTVPMGMNGESSQNFVSIIHSRNLHSSQGSEDLDELRKYNNNSSSSSISHNININTQSEDGIRPSSHLVTISHS